MYLISSEKASRIQYNDDTQYTLSVRHVNLSINRNVVNSTNYGKY